MQEQGTGNLGSSNRQRGELGMPQERIENPEKVLWEEYLRQCNQEGKKPTAQDFAKWARTLMTGL